MANEKTAPVYVPTERYSQSDWDDVSDNPELAADDFARARPLRETMPDLVAAVLRRRGAQMADAQEQGVVEVDRDVLEAYRSTGPGWQRRINDALREAVGLPRPVGPLD